MTLKKNILANYLGAGVIALAPILALPWYLHALGPQQFGLIGVVLMLQAVLGLVDAGMSQALVREITVRLDSTNAGGRRAAFLLFGFERIYWVFALVAGCVTLALSDLIASQWLNLKDVSVTMGRDALYGAAVIFAVQFPGSIYRSVLVGAQAQVTLNSILLCGAMVRHAGGVVIVLTWPTLTAYLTWQAVVSLLETLVRAWFAWRALAVRRADIFWEMNELRQVWKLVASMSGAAWLGALTVQMDKIVLSRTVSIDQFGYYAIAATIAAGALQLIYPLVQAVLPRAIQLRGQPDDLRALSFKLIKWIGLLSAIGTCLFISVGEWLLNQWLRIPSVSNAVYPLLGVLLLGTILNAFYNVGYVNWLVAEKTHRVLQVNALAFVLSLIFMPIFVARFGVIGAAFGWLMINLIGFVFSLEWIRRKKLR